MSSLIGTKPNQAPSNGDLGKLAFKDQIVGSDLAAGSILNANIATGAVDQTKLATGVSGTGPTFQAYVNSTQAVTGGVWTKLTLNAKEWDVTTAFDAVTNYRFTPLVAGYYQLNTACPAVSTAAGANYIGFYKNGSSYKYTSVSTNGIPGLSCMVFMNGSTDYVECYINLGTSQSISASSNNFMSACLVRSA